MLNCTNALEGHIPPAESAALMVAEEKPHPDSCKACQPHHHHHHHHHHRQHSYHHNPTILLSQLSSRRQTIPQTWL
ncbi:hypothetical protein PV325_002074 [Microctonus aethiopoides]|nr:hypothetical protein PV325_002074 [Microctonus aethiopoides]KAK0086827.1 hypothetical protein PV326_005435 [Microctonus aethiopoides]